MDKELEQYIDLALADGVVTEKEKSVFWKMFLESVTNYQVFKVDLALIKILKKDCLKEFYDSSRVLRFTVKLRRKL